MQLAADFKRLRGERGLSLNAVSKYARVDRNTLSRLEDAGTAPRLELLERIARYLGADLNRWRSWAGHPPLEAGFNPDTAINDAIARVTQETGVRLEVDTQEILSARGSPEAVARFEEWLRARAHARKR